MLLKVWFWVVFVLFTLSGSKLISYVLPMFAAAALLTGDWCVRAAAAADRRSAVLWATGLATVVAALVCAAVYLHDPLIRQIEQSSGRPIPRDQITPRIVTFAESLAAVAAVSALSAFGLAVARRSNAALGALAGGMALFLGVAVVMGLPAIDQTFVAPLHEITREGAAMERADLPLAIYSESRRPSAIFYLPDNLVPKKSGEVPPVSEVNRPQELAKLVKSGEPVLLVAPTSTAETLIQSLGARKLSQNGGWALVRIR